MMSLGTSKLPRPVILSVAVLATAFTCSVGLAASNWSAGPTIVKSIVARRGKPLTPEQTTALTDAARARRQAVLAANAQFVITTAKATGLSEADTKAILDNTVIPSTARVGILDDTILPGDNASILDNTVRPK